jgi:NADH-quinone oxidoreductase subunit J
MTIADFLFWCLALFTAGSAIATTLSTQIVRSAVWLMFTLVGVAGLYFQLGFEFLGATQILIYVGGILVLIIFAVMLTAQGPGTRLVTPLWQWIIMVGLGGGLLALMLFTLFSVNWDGYTASPLPAAESASNSDRLALTFLGSTQGEAPGTLTAMPRQQKQRVHYLFLFEVISVHLLVVLIGAAYLARAKRARRRTA